MAKKPLIVFTGESNSGGFSSNASLPASALEKNPNVQILNNTTLAFEDLQIGVNNLIDHDGLSGVHFNIHGWEYGLGLYRKLISSEPVNLVKAGQGGSRISSWETTSIFYTKLLQRFNAAVALMGGIANVEPFIWYSQGINDQIDNLDPLVWLDKTRKHFARLRGDLNLPDLPILLTDHPNYYPAYKEQLIQLAADANNYFVSTKGATVRTDLTHWDAAGSQLIAARFASITHTLMAGKQPLTATAPVSVAARWTLVNTENALIVCDGSISTSTVSDWPAKLKTCHLFDLASCTVQDLIDKAKTTQQMIANATAVDALYSSTRLCVLIAGEIANDLAVKSSVDACNAFRDYCLARKARGFRVVVLTIPGKAGTAEYKKKVYECNQYLIKNYKTFADALVDLGQLPALASAPSIAIPDGTHPTAGAMSSITELITATVQRLAA